MPIVGGLFVRGTGMDKQAMRAETERLIREAMEKIGAPVPKSAYARTLDEAMLAAEKIGFPIIIRPSFTMGGVGGGMPSRMPGNGGGIGKIAL